MPATRHFSFDLTGALAEQLDGHLPTLTPAPLSPDQLELVDPTPGVYQLYLNRELVYVGKADRNLRARLTDHYRKISGRLHIEISDVTFTGLYLEGTWIPVGPEQMLIKRLEDQDVRPPWNFNGFGINDPGKERDSTNFRESHFDVQYPADLGFRLTSIGEGEYLTSEFLPKLKHALPYVFRYEDKRAKHPDYLVSRVTIAASCPTATHAFEAIASGLPPGWQITALPGYVVMYKSSRIYPSARMMFVSG